MSEREQLPTHLTHDAFGEVNVTRGDDELLVSLTLLMEPKVKGAQTAIVLDGSNSMRAAYGRAIMPLRAEVIARLRAQKGALLPLSRDGLVGYRPSAEALEQLRAEGELEYSENLVESSARALGTFLAQGLGSEQGTLFLYWGCGDGAKIERLGTFSGEEISTLSLRGPLHFGAGSQLTPAIQLLTEEFHHAPFSFFVFITDGKIEDFDRVVATTRRLCGEIQQGTRLPMKLVLIGVGDDIDHQQLSALDDLESESGIDLWDHKIAEELRSLGDIFAELGDQSQFVASEGKIYDDAGQLIHHLRSGVPRGLTFSLPPSAKGFSLELNGFLLEQPLPSSSR